MSKRESRRRRTEGSVREERTPCPACGSEETRVLKTQRLEDSPWIDRRTGALYPGRIRRRRECVSCGRLFFSFQGLGGPGWA